jgi:hypothetical protein
MGPKEPEVGETLWDHSRSSLVLLKVRSHFKFDTRDIFLAGLGLKSFYRNPCARMPASVTIPEPWR